VRQVGQGPVTPARLFGTVNLTLHAGQRKVVESVAISINVGAYRMPMHASILQKG